MAYSELIVTPIGRWVNGSMTELVTTDYQGRPIPVEKFHYSVGIAFSKLDPRTNEMLQEMAAHAHTEFAQFPHVQANLAAFNFTKHGGFSWKIKDGDLPNDEGKLFEDSAGCLIVYFTSFKDREFKCADHLNVPVPTSSPLMTRGYKLQVAFTTQGNGLSDANAGHYINPEWFRFVDYDKILMSGVDTATAFAGHNNPAPSGTPMTYAPPSAPPAAPAAYAPPAAPAAYAPPAAPAAYAPPAAPAAYAPPVAPAAYAPPVAPAATYTPPVAPAATYAPPAPPAPPVAPAAYAPPAQPGVTPVTGFANGPDMTRPVDPAEIHAAGTPGEMWWNGVAWVPSPK